RVDDGALGREVVVLAVEVDRGAGAVVPGHPLPGARRRVVAHAVGRRGALALVEQPPTRAGQAGRARVDRRGALLRGRDDALVDVLHARGVHLEHAAVVRPEAVELVLD